MFKRLFVGILILLITAPAFAQQTDAEKIAEIQRQIEILTREIEALKTPQTEKPVQADTQQYGLGAAASKVYRARQGVSFGGYGEFLYQNLDSSSRADTADALRAILYTGYKFNDRVLFNSEVEVEHGSTEHGGAVSLEFGYLDFLVRPEVNFRAGLLLVPMGLINEQHEPTAFFGARRPLVERLIIPATWGELGAGVFGDAGSVSYRAYAVTGLNAAGFEGEEGIREGRQGGAEALAEDWAVVGRADWHPLAGTMIGGSLYRGDSGQGRGFGGGVTLLEGHAEAKIRGLSLRALVARGTVADAAAINSGNGLVGDESVGRSFGGWYVEGGYDLAPLWRRGGETSVAPFIRYERLDTQRSVPSGFSRNPANDRRVVTVGLSFKPVQQTVIKADYQSVDNEAGTGTNQWNLAVGYIF